MRYFMKNMAAAVCSILFILSFAVTALTACPARAAGEVQPRAGSNSLLCDMADILSDSEEAELLAKLTEISQRREMDIVIVTVDGLDGSSIESYTEDFYDYNGYGQGGENNGVILLLDMEQRDQCFKTTGRAIRIFTDARQDYIFDSDHVQKYFRDDKWLDGFMCFADMCDECIAAVEKGEKYPGNPPSFYLLVIGGCVLGGFIVALIIMLIRASKLKTVVPAVSAKDYLVDGSVHITESHDRFLYSTISRRAKPKESSGGGGSTTRIGSSGTRHGGSTRKF